MLREHLSDVVICGEFYGQRLSLLDIFNDGFDSVSSCGKHSSMYTLRLQCCKNDSATALS